MNFIHVTRGNFPFENGFFEYFITNISSFNIKVTYTIVNRKHEIEPKTITLGASAQTWELTNSLTVTSANIVPDSHALNVIPGPKLPEYSQYVKNNPPKQSSSGSSGIEFKTSPQTIVQQFEQYALQQQIEQYVKDYQNGKLISDNTPKQWHGSSEIEFKSTPIKFKSTGSTPIEVPSTSTLPQNDKEEYWHDCINSLENINCQKCNAHALSVDSRSWICRKCHGKFCRNCIRKGCSKP